MPCARTSSEKRARLSGFDLRAVTPDPVHPQHPLHPVHPAACSNLSSLYRGIDVSTSPNIAPKILPFLCFTQPNIVQKPALLVFYATRHRSKSCPSCVLGHPKKVPTKKHKKGKQKVGTKIRQKIVVFQLKIHPFLCFRQIGTAHGP